MLYRQRYLEPSMVTTKHAAQYSVYVPFSRNTLFVLVFQTKKDS